MRKDNYDEVIKLIQTYLTPIQTINKKHSSYRLKHIFERAISYNGYVSNETAIKAMKDSGFDFTDNLPNPFFNVSQNGVNEIIKLQKEG